MRAISQSRRRTAVGVVLVLLASGCGADPPARTGAAAPTTVSTDRVAPPSTPSAGRAGLGPAPVDCPRPGSAPRSSNRLSPTAGSYLGRAGGTASAVDVTPACQIVVGGRFTGLPGGPTTTIGRGGAGALLLLDGTGRRLLRTVRLAGAVEDLEVRRGGGEIAVATDRGAVLLDAAAGRARWQRGGPTSRVAVGSAGTVAALSGSTVTVYDLGGATLARVALGGRTVSDVAVDDRSGLVFVSGFRQTGGARCVPVQIAYVHAYDRRGTLRWRAYDHPVDRLGDLCADSRADRVAMGRDGRLYVAGETAGGNTVFARSAADPGRPAPNVVTDDFSRASNTGNAHYTYLARFDPASGRQLAGQAVISRIDSKGDRGNTITPLAVTADESGRIYAGGVSAYQIAGRAQVTLGGRRLAPYAGGDAWVLVLSADLRRRLTWVVFTDGGAGVVRGVAVAGGVAAAAAQVDRAGFWRGPGPSLGAGGGYLAAWPGLG
ncbi:hypothetical protein COO58_13695 [Micromonospora sp. WMMA1996]|uniref:hypothetical protein n=1 Tax=Micromonospora sp. WMMA1996 TaxID=2039878 RepID=UPI000BF90D61|nr:hypothetical protein [Micromonospora sp. WMMA1996]PGH45357.1 hypothetical protein COO58_13695 [Micromonospora sp. WMMA1996]